jgi:hypothetical protein
LEELDYIFMKDGGAQYRVAAAEKFEKGAATETEKVGDHTYIEEA